MKLLVDRFTSNKDTTLGKLLIDGNFECYTLEDEYRAKKVFGETRIPAGEYQITLRKEGLFHERYLKRFPLWHVGMLWVRNVPGFEYILIHCGNTDDDTAGCLLLGEKIDKWTLVNSTGAYENAYKQIAAALLIGEKVTIEYQDNDR
jgi:hypothetical protein